MSVPGWGGLFGRWQFDDMRLMGSWFTRMESFFEDIRCKISEFRCELDAFKKELDRLAESLKDAWLDIADLYAKVAVINQRLDSLEERMTAAEERLTKDEADIATLEQEVANLQNELNNLQNELNDLINRFNGITTTSDTLHFSRDIDLYIASGDLSNIPNISAASSPSGGSVANFYLPVSVGSGGDRLTLNLTHPTYLPNATGCQIIGTLNGPGAGSIGYFYGMVPAINGALVQILVRQYVTQEGSGVQSEVGDTPYNGVPYYSAFSYDISINGAAFTSTTVSGWTVSIINIVRPVNQSVDYVSGIVIPS